MEVNNPEKKFFDIINIRKLPINPVGIQIPSTLKGITAFGFKIGVFLILKSYVIIRHVDLSTTGYIMVGSQLILAFILIAMGTTMQDERVLQGRGGLKRTGMYYLFGAVLGYTVQMLSNLYAWKFFIDEKKVNWFVDLYNNVRKGIGEISMNVIFLIKNFGHFFVCY